MWHTGFDAQVLMQPSHDLLWIPFDPKPMSSPAPVKAAPPTPLPPAQMPNPTPPANRVPILPASHVAQGPSHGATLLVGASTGLTDLTLPATILEEPESVEGCAPQQAGEAGEASNYVSSLQTLNSMVSPRDSLERVMFTGQFSSVES